MAQQLNQAAKPEADAATLWAIHQGLTDLLDWPKWNEWPAGTETKAKMEERLAQTNTRLYALGEI